MGLSLLQTILLAASVLHASALPSHNAGFERRDSHFTIPSTWSNTTTNLNVDSLKKIAHDTMETMIAFRGSNAADNVGGLGYWPSGNLWSSVALTDLANGKDDFEEATLEALTDTIRRYPSFRYNAWNDDSLWWGLAAVYHYRAYGAKVAQDWAKACWEDVAPQQITGTSGSGKEFTWKDKCDGMSTEGGVFWTNRPDDAYANAITTSLFMTLSAYLYEQTKDEKYFKAAEGARMYVYSHFFHKNADKLVTDGIDVKTCKLTDWKFTYNAGKFIEGLMVLYSAKNWGFYIDDAITLAVAGMKGAPWQGEDGVITEGQNKPYDKNDDGRNFKGIYIRGLLELYRRAPSWHEVRTLIRAYVNVQANSLITHASNDPANPHKFAVNWHGPMDGGYAHGQLAALDVMHAFVAVNHH